MMIYNVYMRIRDASRECGWTQVWLDSFAEYGKAVGFISRYNTSDMRTDMLLAVTANQSGAAYDESEIVLAVGVLEVGNTGKEYIGIISDELATSNSKQAKDLIESISNPNAPAIVLLDHIRYMTKNSSSFHEVMVSAHILFVEMTLALDEKRTYPVVEENVKLAKRGLEENLYVTSRRPADMVYRSAFEENIHSASYAINNTYDRICIYYCSLAAESHGINMNKKFKNAILSVVTAAKAYCDYFFS